MNDESSPSKKTKKTEAEEVAETMVANMEANMKDPIAFWNEKELRERNALEKILRERKKSNQEELHRDQK